MYRFTLNAVHGLHSTPIQHLCLKKKQRGPKPKPQKKRTKQQTVGKWIPGSEAQRPDGMQKPRDSRRQVAGSTK